MLYVGALLAALACAACSDAPRGTASCASGTVAISPGEVCVERGDQRGQVIVAQAREQMRRDNLRAAILGVWIDGDELVSAALGESEPGVPATRDMHFRVGDVTEAMSSTLLLKLVEQQRIALDAPLSTWFPEMPNAHLATLQMLASMTTGFVDFVTTPAFFNVMDAEPYRFWTPDELIAFSASQTPLFAPGTSWAFSDTNFVLLGEVLARLGQTPLADQLRTQVLDPLGLDGTSMTVTPEIPSPVLHALSIFEGQSVDATFWSPSWIAPAGNMISTLADMRVWAEAVANGTLLSPASHALQIGTQSVGLGPLTPEKYYGLGVAIAQEWVFSNPHVPGYGGFITYFPPEKITVVVMTTPGPGNADDQNYGQDIFLRIAELLTPDHVPDIGQRTH